MKRNAAARWARSVLFLAFAVLGLEAQAAQLQVFIDTDNNTATGCTIVTPAGNFVGAEEVLTTNIDTTVSPPAVGAIVQQACVAPPAGLGAPVAVSPGGWNVGLGVGVGGTDVIETFFPAAAPAGTYRFGFAYVDPVTGPDALFTVTGAPGGGPIVFAFGAATAIPTLTDAAIFLLAFLVWLAAARALKRRQLPTALVSALFVVVMAGATLAAVTLDGQITDWAGISPIANDPLGDANPGSDIRAAFVKFEQGDGRLYIRADVRTASGPAATADAYATATGVPLVVAAPGVLANDSLGVPLATLTSFGGGSLGGAVTDNAAGATVALAGGTVTVNADGSVSFSPAVAGSYTVQYRLSNVNGTSDGTVTFTVSQVPAITSANAATFTVGAANTFTVTATGFPAPAITFGACAPALPAGVTFIDNANGTGTLAGNPPSGSAGAYACTVNATNSAGSAPPQAFTLTVNEGPVAVADAYSVAHDTVLNVPAGTGLLANDSGTPAPAVSSVTGSGPACTVFPCAIATTNGNATVAADGSFSYTPNALFAGADGFSYVATNAGGSSGAAVTITVTSAPPVVDLNGPAAGIDFGPVAFTEGGGAVAIVDGAQLTVTDADSANLASATVAITNLLDGASESLAVTCPAVAPGCSGAILAADVVYTPGTGTLTITRAAPLADYQALLRTLAYANASAAPTTTTRDITVTVNDAITDNSPLAHATVTIGAVNNAPTVTVPATATTPVNAAFNFAATVSVGDPDAGTSPVKVTITTTNGTAMLSGTAGLVVTGNGTGSVVSTGPLAAQNAALTGLVYTPTAAYAGPATLKVDIDDQGNTGTGGPLTATGTVAITVDNPPAVTSTLPANGATSVGTNATVTVNFSEPVTVTGSAFTLACPTGSPVAFTVAPASPAASFTLTPGATLPAGVTCTLTVVASQVTDSGGQPMTGDFTATFSTNTLPTVTTTVPANGATAVAPSTTVTVNFSEPVNATGASFTLQCPVATPVAFTLSASPSNTFVLTPSAPLPVSTACTVTVVAAGVTDVDASQPMVANYVFGFTTATPPAITSAASANFTVGSAGTFTVTATGNPTPGLTRTGTLPSGLNFLDNGDGTATLSGTPAGGTDAASPYAQVMTATNLAGSATQNFTLNVCPVISSTPASIPQPTRTNAYSTTLAGSGGTGPYTFAVTGGAPPGGLTLAPGGLLSGTVTGAGAYSFTVTVTDTANGCTGTTAYSGTVNEPPVAGADTFDAVGNTTLEVKAAGAVTGPRLLVTTSNLLSNDNDGNGGANGTGVTATAGTFATVSGGSVTLAANGEFTYEPPVSFTGADSFTYTVSDGIGTATGTVTINVAQKVWYVKNDAPAGGDGRSATPYNTLASAISASGVGDTVYVAAGNGTGTNHDGNSVLKNSQRFIGEGVALTVPGTFNGVASPVLKAAGATPTVGNVLGGDSVTLATDNTVAGLAITGTAPGIAITGGSVGTLSITSTSVNTAGAGVSLTGAGLPSVNVVLSSLSANGGPLSVNLVGPAGTADLGSGALNGATGNSFVVNGGTANVSYAGTIANAVAGAQVVSVQNKTGGTVNLSGAVTGTGARIFLSNNAGSAVNFSGGMGITTNGNPAFVAQGGGTVTATQNNTTIVNALSATSDTALSVTNTTIGAAGLTFRSISSQGGNPTGIVLDNTGGAGALAVVGNGAPASGGTIANKGGTDGDALTGNGIFLRSTASPSFQWMQLNDFANFAIRGFVVNGFTLANSVINGTNGNSHVAFTQPNAEGSVAFGAGSGEFGGPANGLTGAAAITNTAISGAFENNLRVVNQSGALDRLVLDGVTIGANSTTDGNDGVLVEPQGTATIRMTVNASSFTSARGDMLQYVDNGSASNQDLVLTGNSFINGHPAIATGGGGVTISSGFNNDLPLTISGNTFRGAVGHAVLIVKTTGFGTLSGTFANNVIGASGVANSGSAEGSGLKLQTVGQGTVTMAITNNQIRQYNNYGIELLAGGGATAQPGAFNTTITGNTIEQPGTTAGSLGTPKNGVHLNIGTVPGDTFTACSVITGNTLFASGADASPPVGSDFDVRLRQRQSTTIRLPGYAGATTDNAAVAAFVVGNNLSGGVPTAIASNTGIGFTGGGATCP